MGKSEAKSAYVHYVPPAKRVADWYKRYNFVLITSMEQLEDTFKKHNWTPKKSFISFDTETTGLDPEELDIVGYSFCIDGVSAYYVPVNHFQYEHNLGIDSCRYIYERMCEAQKVFLYNARFDLRVMEHLGYKEHKEEFDKKHRWNYVMFDMSKVPVMDVMNAVWNADSNLKLPSLKQSSLHYLGYEQMHFDEVIEGAGNFYYLNPEETPDTVFYAAADALCTYLLVPAVMKYYKEAGVAGQLDDAVIYPLMHYESEKLWLDYEKLCQMFDEASEEVNKCENEVYNTLGYQINLNSPVQVAQALERLGIDTGERTASGKMATGSKVLESLSDDIKDKFPALKAYVNFKEVGKLLNTYLSVYKKEAERQGYLRASYKLHQVPTGRLACGTDGKNSYFSKVNIQAMPKPHVSMYDVFDLGDRDLFSKKDNIILGYHFVMSEYDENKQHIIPNDSRYIGQAEGMNPKLNVRSCITPKWKADDGDEEYIYTACDYAAQELRIVANISKEPVWADAFVHGRDVHKATACAVWGEENYNKDLRKRAKGVNFAVVYGAQAASFNDPSYGIYSLAEAEEFYNNYKSKLPTLFQWIDRKQRQGRKNGTVYTYFGRPRRVKGYFDNHNASFANRTIINTQIQGCHVYDNMVLTNYGYIKIGELYDEFQRINQDMNIWKYKVWNGFKWCDFFPVERGKDVRYKLHFDNGQIIECDSRHKVKVFKESSIEWVNVNDLIEGEDAVCFNRLSKDLTSQYKIQEILGGASKNSTEYKMGILFNRNDLKVLCYIYGAVLGDGHIGYGAYVGDGTRAGISITYGLNAKKQASLGAIRKFLKSKGIYCYDRVNENHVSKSGTISPVGELVCDCYPLVDAIRTLTGDCGGNTYTKRLGKKVFALDRELVFYVLRGIYDTDGIALSGGTHLVNEGLVRDIQLLMLYFGYDSWIRHTEGKDGNSDSYCVTPHNYDNSYVKEIKGMGKYCGDWKFSTLKYHNHILEDYDLRKMYFKQSSESDYVVYKRVKNGGSCEMRTFRKFLDIIKDIDYSATFEDYDYHIIKEVEKTEEVVDTYTLCVLDDSHQYVCEGMISHNTAADILKLVCCRLWKNLLNNDNYKDDVRFMLTIHDEIGYSVRVKRLEEILSLIEENQTVILKEWPIPIITEASVGWSPGGLFAFEKVEDSSRPMGFSYRPKLD